MSDENTDIQRPGAITAPDFEPEETPDLNFARKMEGVLDQITLDVTNTSIPIELTEDPVSTDESKGLGWKMPGWGIGLSIGGGVILIAVVIFLILRSRGGH